MQSETAAVLIVEPISGGKFNLNEAELQKILLHPRVANTKVVPVVIVGEFHIGKSFLMTYILRYLKHRKSDATGDWLDTATPDISFHKDSTLKTTKGIYLWPDPFLIRDSNGEQVALLLMQCQELNDKNTMLGGNVLLFALTALTASTTIYNIGTNIGQNNLPKLQFFAKFGEIVVKSYQSQKPFQSLIFMVHDWQYPKVEEKEYGFKSVDAVLKPNDFKSVKALLEQKELNIHHQIHGEIEIFFDSVRVFLMPGAGEDIYFDQLRVFVEDIFSSANLKPKLVKGEAVTGKGLAECFNEWFSLYNGKVPEPKSSIDSSG